MSFHNIFANNCFLNFIYVMILITQILYHMLGRVGGIFQIGLHGQMMMYNSLCSKRALVSPNFLVLPKGLETAPSEGDFIAKDAQVEMYYSISTITNQVDDMPSNRINRYMLHYCTSPNVYPLDPFFDLYIHYELPFLIDLVELLEDFFLWHECIFNE